MLSLGCISVCSVTVLVGGEPGIRGNAFVELTNQLGAGVNSGYESAPSISPDGLTLFFASGRVGGLGSWDIYAATRAMPEGPFTQVSNVGAPVNTAGGEAWAQLSGDGRTLIFVRGAEDREHNFLWWATRPGPAGPFTDARELREVNAPGTSNLLPSLSADELKLFFAALRPEGPGMFDVWVSTCSLPDGRFDAPVILEEHFQDSQVNSWCDDTAPCLVGSELALFLSDDYGPVFRPGGLGLADIWISEREDTEAPFPEPVNLNARSLTPVNTQALELYPAVSRSWPLRRAELYFVSNRSGALEIWRAVWEAVPEPSFTVAGPDAGCSVTVDASASTTPEGTMPLRYRWDFRDGTTGDWSIPSEEWRTVSHPYATPGRFVITLTVVNALGVESTVTAIVTIPCSCAPGGDVAPWTAEDVGWPIFPGRSWMDGDDLEVCAGGRGFGGSADELHFVHQAFTGDFVLTVRVSDVLDWGGSGGSVGLMARDGLEPGARFAAVLLERAATVARQRLRYREAPDASGRSGTATTIRDPVVPRWLRLERCGDLFVGRSSADGAAWEEVDRQEIAGMPERLLVGVAATGKDSGDPARDFTPLRARLSNLRLAPASDGFVRGEANQDGGVDLSDAVSILGYLFLGGSLECQDAGDVDDDGAVVITDAIALLNFLFLGGPAPAAPYPEAGPDPTEDALGCGDSSGCE